MVRFIVQGESLRNPAVQKLFSGVATWPLLRTAERVDTCGDLFGHFLALFAHLVELLLECVVVDALPTGLSVHLLEVLLPVHPR